jgi:hypothetical protein
MAQARYVSASGNNTTATSWATARTSLSSAAGVDTAGDVLWVAHTHSENPGVGQTWSFAGTYASPTVIQCVDASAEPPTTRAYTAQSTIPGVLTISGVLRMIGLSLTANGITLGNINGDMQCYDRCSFTIPNGNPSVKFTVGATSGPSLVRWNQCDVVIGDPGNNIQVNSPHFEWFGGSVTKHANNFGGSPTYTIIFGTSTRPCGYAVIEGVDFSALDQVSFSCPGGGKVILKNCKMPAGWTWTTNGNRMSGDNQVVGQSIEYWNCYAAGSSPSGKEIAFTGRSGLLVHEPGTLQKTNTSTGEVSTAIWKVNTPQGGNYWPFRSPDIFRRVSASDDPITVRMDFTRSGSLNNAAMCWLEVEYYSASGQLLGAFASSEDGILQAGPGTSGATNYPASSDTSWSGTYIGAGWAYYDMDPPQAGQYMAVSFTPAVDGYILVRAVSAALGGWFDPNIRVY